MAIQTACPTTATRCRIARTVTTASQLRQGVPSRPEPQQRWGNNAASLLLGAAAASALLLMPVDAALAVAGGGGVSGSLAFSDQTNRDLSGKNYVKADLRGADFSGSDLTGATLFAALCDQAKFVGSTMRFASLEQGNFEGADMTDAILEGAQVSGAKFKVGGRKATTITNTDWTDVILRKDVQKELCTVASGTNPKTGVDTRESLMCP